MLKLGIISLIGPFLFLGLIIAFSVVYSVKTNLQDSALISEYVSSKLTWILLLVQIGLLVTSIFIHKKISVDTFLDQPSSLITSIFVGVCIGAIVFFLYINGLEKNLIQLQKYWDYIPAGSIVSRVSQPLSIFFIANCLLAPFTEELVYRGWILPSLIGYTGITGAVIISSLLFGVLHWAGGLWYILLTATFLGLPAALLYVYTGGLLAPLMMHLTLNLLEFGYATYLNH